MTIINTDLLTDVVTSYDQTKTTIFGRVSQKVINSSNTLGPSVPNYADVVLDSTGVIPSGATFPSSVLTGDSIRIFVAGTPTAGSLPILLYNQNLKTGAMTYVGRVNMLNQSVLTTTLVRGLEAIDTGTTGWKIFIAVTNAVLINGGLYLLNNIDLADFTPLGVNIPLPTGNDQKANYFLQDPSLLGVGQLHTTATGVIIDSVSNRIYCHNGLSATHQYYVYSTSTAPTYSESAITITNANPGVVTFNSHGYLANDPVLFKTTGTVSGLVTNTVYFVRNQSANTFELSLTSGGVSINTTGSQSGTHTIGRAYGITGSNFVHKTGNLPALLGTLLLTNGENLAVPAHVSYGSLVGQRCAAFGTSSNLYMGLLSELTSGATTWPSLATANLLGPLNDVTAVAATFSQYSAALDAFVFISNTSLYYAKRLVNNDFLFKGGRLNTDFYEGKILSYGDARFGSALIVGFNMGNGVGYIVSSTTGQRGIVSLDMRSDAVFEQDYVITKVLSAQETDLRGLLFSDELYDISNTVNVYYRTSGFGSASGGWTLIPNINDVSITLTGQVQFKFLYNVVGYLSQTAAQISNLLVITDPRDASSNNWEYSQGESTSGSPTRAAFRLRYAYSSAIPSTLRFKSYDLSGTLLLSQTITTNPANFEYSTDSGVTWLPLGTIPNVSGTLLRYTFSSPPGIDIRPSLRDA